jgi:hypothetical protein
VIVDHTVPTVVFADAQDLAHPSGSGSIGATIDDNLSLVTGLSCTLDGQPIQQCGTSHWVYSNEPGCSNGCTDFDGVQHVDFADLADGVHNVQMQVTDTHSNTQTYSLAFKVDTVAPSVTQSDPTARFTLATRATLAWTGSDAVAGIASYGLQWRRAPYNGDFGAWSSSVSLTPATHSKTYSSLTRGATYCYHVDATDKAGNTSAWTPQHCTAIPLDDRDLADAGSWKPVSASGYFMGTAMATKVKGDSLAVTGAKFKRIAVVAKKCSACGQIGVYVGGVLKAKLDLHAATTSRALLTLPVMALTTGTVKLKVLSSGKLVQIDALGLSQV